MLELIDPVLIWKNSPKWLKGTSIAFMIIGVNPMVGLPGAILYEAINPVIKFVYGVPKPGKTKHLMTSYGIEFGPYSLKAFVSTTILFPLSFLHGYYIANTQQYSPNTIVKVGIFAGVVTGWTLVLTNGIYGLFGRKKYDFVD